MSLRETLGLNKKKEQEFKAIGSRPPPQQAAQSGNNANIPAAEDFELTHSEPIGAAFEVGEELTPPRVIRLTNKVRYFRIVGRGTIKEHKREKRTMRNYLLPVEEMMVNEFGKLENQGYGMLTAHPSLGQILYDCEIGTCVSIVCLDSDRQNRYQVHKIKVQI